MQYVGLEGLAPQDLIVDGVIHRFKPTGDKRDSGWYVLHYFRTDAGQDLITGAFGNWKDDIKETVQLEGLKQLSTKERARLQAEQQHKAEVIKHARAEAAEIAAERARNIWQDLPDNGACGYLNQKKVRAFGLRFSRGGIAIPLRNIAGIVRGLQFIFPSDEGFIKKFLSDIDPTGCFHLIGEIDYDGPLLVCEGYATGATLYKAKSWPVAVAFNAGNLLPVAQALRAGYPKTKILIAGDDDIWTPNNPGRTKAQAAAATVEGLSIFPRFTEPAGKTDFNDLYVAEGLEAVQEQLDGAFSDAKNWRKDLHKNKDDKVTGTLPNIATILLNDDRWRGVLAYCEFSYRIMKLRPPPFGDSETGEWSDADTLQLRIWLSENYRISTRTNETDDAVLVASKKHRYHPVRNYLEGLKWDGISRVPCWLPMYLDTPGTDYDQAIGKKFLIAAVARVMEPGCKMDYVLILESMQGVKKSTVLDVLARPWFSDTHFDIGHKDGYQQMQGTWLYELAELDNFNKAESTRAKQFFGSQQDRFRPSYGRRVQDFARQCVFVGTTNLSSYLKDPTGNRRYWPVMCGAVDIEALRRDRDQLWAEAYYLYQRNEIWWPTETEEVLFGEEQEKRFNADIWEDLIVEWINDAVQQKMNSFRGAEIFVGALKMDPSQMKPPEQMRLGMIMHRLGWGKKRRRVSKGYGEGNRVYTYERPLEDRIPSDKTPEDDF